MQPQQEQNYWQPDATDPVNTTPAPQAGVIDRETEDMDPGDAITWQASEFVHHEKSAGWFLVLIGIATVLLLIDLILIKSWTFGILIVVMTIAVIALGRKPPRTLRYSLSHQGVRIEDKLYSFHDFHAFGIVREQALYSLRLVPNKRFMPMVALYFPEEQGEQIVDLIGSVLPMEHIERDPIDKIAEKIRF